MALETNLAFLKGKDIRKNLHNGEWWFAIVDVVSVLTDSVNPSDYIKDMRWRDSELTKSWRQFATPLSIEASGGTQKVECANGEGIFRIIQSIPSPKAESYKHWLAKVGYERIQEIQEPELATGRTKALYRAKGYSEAWIEKRMCSIAFSAKLTDEWNRRGIMEQPECSVLMVEISKAAFGVTPSEYKELKGLQRENLRDHMTDLELIFLMLGEAATTEIARKQDSQGCPENRVAARKGGKIAGDAREKLEIETEANVISPENYLTESEERRRLNMKNEK